MTRRIRDFAGGVALGSVLAFFFHPAAGRRERTLARDRALGVSRRGGRRVKRAGRRIVAQVYGVSQHARHLRLREGAQRVGGAVHITDAHVAGEHPGRLIQRRGDLIRDLLLPIAGGITGYKKEKEREHGAGEATAWRARWGGRL